MDTQAYKLKVTFLTELLGSQPTRAIASEYLAARNNLELAEDESLALPEVLERGTTVFYRYPGEPGTFALRDYMIKGFIKEAGKVFNGRAGLPKNLRSKLDNAVFIFPRWIRLNLNGGEMDYLERPLRAETAQGPRVALARSEMLPAGTWFECQIEIMPSEITRNVLESLLDYGYYKGIGQWRNGGNGQFRYILEEEAAE